MLKLLIRNKHLVILKALHHSLCIWDKNFFQSRIIFILIKIYNILFVIQIIFLQFNLGCTEFHIIPAPVQIFLFLVGMSLLSSGMASLPDQALLTSHFLKIILESDPGTDHFRQLHCIIIQNLLLVVFPIILLKIRISISRHRKLPAIDHHSFCLIKNFPWKIHCLFLQANYIFLGILHIHPFTEHAVKAFSQTGTSCDQAKPHDKTADCLFPAFSVSIIISQLIPSHFLGSCPQMSESGTLFSTQGQNIHSHTRIFVVPAFIQTEAQRIQICIAKEKSIKTLIVIHGFHNSAIRSLLLHSQTKALHIRSTHIDHACMRAGDLLPGNTAQSKLWSQIIRNSFSFTYFIYFGQKLYNFFYFSVQAMSAPICLFIVITLLPTPV